MTFTAKDVAKLREITGAGMMDCKKALTHTDGDMDKAAEYLREQGVNVAAKKASRIASEGAVATCTSADKKIGALVEINCESDFVAKSDPFVELCNNVAKQVIETNPQSLEELLNEKSVVDNSSTITDLINNATAKIGEKLALRRYARMDIDGVTETYIHMGGKIGVMLGIKTGKDLTANEEFMTACHDIALHIAAFGPKYTYENEVPQEDVDHEREILKAQILNDPKTANKPSQVIDKMLVGRLNKFYKEVCLIDQEFVKDPSITIKGLIEKLAKANDTEVSIVSFERFVMGEGLEKKNENFAEEIAKMANK